MGKKEESNDWQRLLSVRFAKFPSIVSFPSISIKTKLFTHNFHTSNVFTKESQWELPTKKAENNSANEVQCSHLVSCIHSSNCRCSNAQTLSAGEAQRKPKTEQLARRKHHTYQRGGANSGRRIFTADQERRKDICRTGR